MKTNEITNVKKGITPGSGSFWKFEYKGHSAIVVEDGNEGPDKIILNISVKFPGGKYLHTVHVSPLFLAEDEKTALLYAAEHCERAYENKIKQND